MKITNRWNQWIYRLWAPIYDLTINHFFMPGRKRAIELLALKPGERVLILGIGTGADLPLLPTGIEAVGIDTSPEMLAKARAKLPLVPAHVCLIQGDAQRCLVEAQSFDAVILNLILSVIPDGQVCLAAALAALKPTGRAVVFDKFLPDNAHPSFGRRILNGFSTLLGTDINRRFGELSAGCACVITHDEPSLVHGMYRIKLLSKR